MNEQAYRSAPILKLFFKCTLPAMVGMGCGIHREPHGHGDLQHVRCLTARHQLLLRSGTPAKDAQDAACRHVGSRHPRPDLATRRCLGAQFRFQRFQCSCGGGDCKKGIETNRSQAVKTNNSETK